MHDRIIKTGQCSTETEGKQRKLEDIIYQPKELAEKREREREKKKTRIELTTS